jgi:hypothetical protein
MADAEMGASAPKERRSARRMAVAEPVALGIISAIVAAWIWGWRNPPPIVSDEGAYLLQARIFAGGSWTAPPRPLPRFFEQMQVFTTPVLASKYPPGHSILMIPGIWLHWPALVPLLLAGGSAALFFILARRIAGTATALLAWTIWTTSMGFRVVSTTYLSEGTTLFLWMAVWMALDNWLRTGRTRWLVLVSVGIAWCAITRPLTAVALAIPAAGVVALRAFRRRSALGPALAAVAGAAVLAIVPIWNRQTLGNFWVTPYAEYSRVYFPYEKLGFGEDPAAPLAPLPPGYGGFDREYRSMHRNHTWRSLPRTAARRLVAIMGAVTEGRSWLTLFFAVGLFAARPELRFALLTGFLLFLLYLALGHPPEWIVYYDETFPVISLTIAMGLWALFVRIGRAGASFTPALARIASPAALSAALAAALFAGALPSMAELRRARRQETAERHAILEFTKTARMRAILFLPCSDRRRDLCDAVQNVPNLERENVWLVHDRGSENATLMRAAPDRIPLLYDPDQRRLVRFAAP